MMGITASGVAVEHIVMHDQVAAADRWLFCGALAIAMSASAVIHLTSITEPWSVLRHSSAWWRFAAAVSLILLGVLGDSLQSYALLGIAALVCLSQVVLDVGFDVHEGDEPLTGDMTEQRRCESSGQSP